MLPIAAVVGLLGCAVHAKNLLVVPPTIKADWVTWRKDAVDETVEIKEGGAAAFATLTPKALFRLETSFVADDGKQILPSGSLLIDTNILWGKFRGQRTACELARQPKHESHICLVDQDTDGKYESAMSVWSGPDFYFSSINRPSPKKVNNGVQLRPMDKEEHRRTTDLVVYYQSHANWVGEFVFKFCVFDSRSTPFGRVKDAHCLPEEIVLKDSDFPKQVPLLGGSVDFQSRSGNTVIVRLKRPSSGVSF